MTYYAGSHNGSWTETCTLPASEQPLCIESLDVLMERLRHRLSGDSCEGVGNDSTLISCRGSIGGSRL